MADFFEPAPRLPTHLEVSGLIRSVEAAGGFAMVLAKGERDAGSLLVIVTDKGMNQKAFERMPALDGDRVWTLAKAENPLESGTFGEWIERRRASDPDLWIVELDIPDGERFIGSTNRSA